MSYPKDWEIKKLEDISDVRDGTHDSPIYVSNGYPLVTSKNIKNGSVDYNDIQFITKFDYDKISKRSKVDKFDILMGMIGTIGNVALVRNEPNFAIKNVALIKDIGHEINQYLFYYLQSGSMTSQIEENVDGGIQKFIPLNKIRRILVALPSKKEREKIISTLSTFDTHIDNLTALIEKKKAIRDGALADLMSGRTRLEGFSGEWEEMSLSEFTEINPRTELPNRFTYIDLESVKGISIVNSRRENIETAPSRARRYAQKGDVFFQTVRPYQKNNYLFYLDGDFVFSTGYAQLRTKNCSRYLFLLIRMDDFVNHVLDNCTGTSYPAINPTRLGKIKVYVPVDVNEQKAIADIITSMDTEIQNLETERDKFMQIREGAMDDLLTGRVRLPM